ncbi:MAG: HPr family phosphocarrier protein [Propylenella sp.]
MLSRHVTIVNRRGLHARAAARFVKCAGGFDAAIHVVKDGQSVEGTSIMGLMTLAAAPGSSIELTAEGPEAEAAMEALAKLVESRFGEEE